MIFSAMSFAQDSNFHIYLCFGQSNMEGSAYFEPQDTIGVERFKVLQTIDCPERGRKKGEWYTATPPLSHCFSHLSPADYFGRTMVKNLPDSITVGVLNVAVGGSDIRLFDKEKYKKYTNAKDADWWIKRINDYNGNPYQRLIEMAKIAQKNGIIKGFLLHQGEANTGDTLWPSYVKVVYENLLHDLNLNAKDIPLLAGEVVHADQKGKFARMNPVINTLPQFISNAHIVSSSGCTVAKDMVHFDTKGCRKLGRRYAYKMLSLVEE